MTDAEKIKALQNRIRELEAEVASLRQQSGLWPTEGGATVRVPESMRARFEEAQKTVASYFSDVTTDPTQATIKISGERYVLMRASALSVGFLKTIQSLYSDHGEHEAMAIGRSFLFDIAHVIGREDARLFHEKMGLTDPIARLSTGPVHFAYSGWAFVEISDDSSPSPDENFFIKYDHPFSFEADAWLSAGESTTRPVCIMNAGYSSGWCEQSFGIELTAVELTCKAAGDSHCTFVMAHPSRIRDYVQQYMPERHQEAAAAYQIPTFFERKRVEEEMKAAREKAEESDRLKSEFLTNISHEIRTPMNSLIGMTELVLDTALTSEQREHLNTVLDSAESLMVIINQILDFSKIESGKFQLEAEPFELRNLLAETLRPLEIRAEPKGVQLKCQIGENVPNRLVGDANRLKQVLVNLIGNAVKFTDSGSVVTAVAAEQATDRGLMLHFAVRDTGIGIPEEKLDSIFEAFTQVDMSSTREYGGTGLGLAISARLVDLLGGNIWAENNANGPGSTFHFTAQFVVDTPPEHPELVGQPVLVVSDRAQHLGTLQSALQRLRMKVVTCTTASEAREILLNPQLSTDRSRFIVLSDLTDNVVMAEMLRGEPETRALPMIALMTTGDAADITRLKKLKVDHCLVNPIKQSALIEALKSCVDTESLAARETPEPAPTPSSEPASSKGIRILLAEDGIANQRFAVSLLSRWGHEVVVANNGQEAIEKLQDDADRFDLILMDVLMPVMDGMEATRKIREQEQGTDRHIPIVAVTAQAMTADREKCIQAGMDGYLSKPIRRKELQDLIAQLVH